MNFQNQNVELVDLEALVTNKICSKCNTEKNIENFNKTPTGKYGVRGDCKECESKRRHLEYLNNREYIIKKSVKYVLYKYKTDINYKIRHIMRSRVNRVLKKKIKDKPITKILGNSIEFIRNYLQSLFKIGMSWENHGEIWEIDHIIPLSIATNKNEVYELCHYTNLQPLFKIDNRKKSNKCLKTKNITQNRRNSKKNKYAT
jgi:hypothetical protein